jgi:hypothetical protein
MEGVNELRREGKRDSGETDAWPRFQWRSSRDAMIGAFSPRESAAVYCKRSKNFPQS